MEPYSGADKLVGSDDELNLQNGTGAGFIGECGSLPERSARQIDEVAKRSADIREAKRGHSARLQSSLAGAALREINVLSPGAPCQKCPNF